MALLEVKGLTKYFDLSGDPLSRFFRGTKLLKAVDHVSFAIKEGETFGLVGESGCGKSTTARLITRLIAATEGEVIFQNRNILSLPKRRVREIRSDIQMVFQDPFASLNPRMKVLEIVGRPVTLYQGLKGKKKLDTVAELLGRVGLQPEAMHRYPHEFSGGQRQRIGVARALAVEPDLIVCDEPVSALDVSVQAQIINLLMDLQQQRGIAYLFIAHDLA
ncbi:MAG: ATP-binding cassette domain-containing protein, partial [Candidatus Binatia bacterium]